MTLKLTEKGKQIFDILGNFSVSEIRVMHDLVDFNDKWNANKFRDEIQSLKEKGLIEEK